MNVKPVWIKATAEPSGSEQRVINCTVGDEDHDDVTLAIEPENVLLAEDVERLLKLLDRFNYDAEDNTWVAGITLTQEEFEKLRKVRVSESREG